MKINEFYKMIQKKPIILDGATGSNLQKAGMKPGVCPEEWILENEDKLIALQKAFVEAGTNILYAPTFSGNRIKLEEYGLSERAEEINKRLVALSKKAAGNKALVAGDMTMTGIALEPVGPMKLETLIDIYKEQARYLVEAGVDLFVVETMMSLAETRAAVIAIKDPVTAVVVLQSIGADVIGVNCSTGPKEMIPVIRKMKEYAEVPLLAKPNAGLPVLQDGVTVYPMLPEEFASWGPEFIEAGAGLIGGCCGTTPEHIRMLSQKVAGLTTKVPHNEHPVMLASERKSQEIALDGKFLVIGERINPTGKKKLQEELRAGKMNLVEEMAEQQEEMGAHILDINMGTNGIDEKEMMLKAISKVTMVSSLPLCIDTSYVEVMEAALRVYPGRALINSISLEKEKIEKLLPLAKKYGAMFILLPLSDKGLPKSLEEKKAIINEILERAKELGISKNQIIVDGLVTTVGANKNAAIETLETIRYCKEDLMAIANPSNQLLMGISFASDLLRNKEGSDIAYIEQIQRMAPLKEAAMAKAAQSAGNNGIKKTEQTDNKSTAKEADKKKNPVFEAVLKGNKDGIVDFVKEELSQGTKPGEILDGLLIPAINEVGTLFDKQIYFLPQLISSANTMEQAVEYLEPLLKEGGTNEKMPTIIIATVEGDIHDIGKNLVALMLRNYGYEVIDLGKDVPADKIIAAAKEHNASIIVLSALMTTTMMRMKDTIALKQKENLNVKVMIGGAVTTQSFADEIGADGYSKDAADAVRLAKKLLSE